MRAILKVKYYEYGLKCLHKVKDVEIKERTNFGPKKKSNEIWKISIFENKKAECYNIEIRS